MRSEGHLLGLSLTCPNLMQHTEGYGDTPERRLKTGSSLGNSPGLQHQVWSSESASLTDWTTMGFFTFLWRDSIVTPPTPQPVEHSVSILLALLLSRTLTNRAGNKLLLPLPLCLQTCSVDTLSHPHQFYSNALEIRCSSFTFSYNKVTFQSLYLN